MYPTAVERDFRVLEKAAHSSKISVQEASGALICHAHRRAGGDVDESILALEGLGLIKREGNTLVLNGK